MKINVFVHAFHFFLQNAKEHILKNVGNQTVLVSIDKKKHIVWKYLLLYSTEKEMKT